jgi:hypothetical protein
MKKDVLQTRVFCATCVFKISFRSSDSKIYSWNVFANVQTHCADFHDKLCFKPVTQADIKIPSLAR